ncbi:MAG: NapC/NirT family cytochrome c [bacterium]
MGIHSETESEVKEPQADKRDKKDRFSTCIKRYWQQDPIRFAIWFGILFLSSVVLMSLILEYSYRPQSCILCHEMQPAHESWGKSFHASLTGSKEDCLACHTAPGFGGKIKAKLGGFVFLWSHILENYDDDIKAEKPVYCVRSGCHTEPWKMDRGSSIRVNHALHLSKGYACVICHDRIAHGQDPEGLNLPTMKDFCFPCHNDEIASRTDCQYCHIYQDAMLQGNAGEGIPEGEFSGHEDARLSCVDCHTGGCVPKPVQTCLSCHSDAYISRQEAERAWVSKSIQKLEEGLPRLEDGIKKAEDMGQDISQINGIYNLVQDVYDFLKADGSRGAHNPAYSRYLLENTIDQMDYAFLVLARIRRVAF